MISSNSQNAPNIITDTSSRNRLIVYFGDKEFPTYEVYGGSFRSLAICVYVDSRRGEKPREKMLLQI